MIEILVDLKDGAKSFNDLRRLHFSPSTILARLREAQAQGLVNQSLCSCKGKKTRARIKYDLTNEGKVMLKSYESIIDRYIELRKELDELESTLREKEKQMKYLLLHEGGERVDKESRV
jgi:DNA-binding HxlR family transcriptional regulator